MHIVLSVIVAAVLVGPALGAEDGVPPPSGSDGLKAGDMLDQSNWQKAEGLLPPEILDHYRKGEYANRIVDWPEDVYRWPPDFLEATKANEGRFDVGESGEIIDKKTGEQPPYVLGFPFPKIDPKDPQAGIKVVWNFFYRTWYFGAASNESQLNWVNAKGLERRTDVTANFMYLDGVPADEKLPNPNNLLSQQLVVVRSPVDVHGTASLSWRYRDPGKRDSAWTYVPALRRVRAVSPANRSDGFLGSDMSQDDGPIFDGKPEDFTWKLTGEVEQLRFVDPLNLQGKWNAFWMPTGGWRANWPPDLKMLGYMEPTWKGVAWAPLSAALAKRPFYVVEAVPKDKYYLFGRLQLYIDRISFQGAWNRKFSWKGELLNSMQVLGWVPAPFTRPSGKVDYLQASNMAFQCVENVARNQATVAGIKSDPKSGFDSRIEFDKRFFDMQSLQRFGK
jgi:hypothetical protein